MPDITGQKSSKAIIASGDYKSSDPAVVTLKRGIATGIEVTITPTLLSGAGCTVTCTVTDADTTAVLKTIVVTTTGATVAQVPCAASNRRVALTCVGSGTRTTLTYSVNAVWKDVVHNPNIYWDGTSYVSSEGQNP